jgi:hypothetical protein
MMTIHDNNSEFLPLTAGKFTLNYLLVPKPRLVNAMVRRGSGSSLPAPWRPDTNSPSNEYLS